MAPKPPLHTIEVGNRDEGVMMTDYNGMIGLLRYQRGRDSDTKFVRMCHPTTRNGPSEKKLPMGVDLGNKEQAIAALKQFVAVLERY